MGQKSRAKAERRAARAAPPRPAAVAGPAVLRAVPEAPAAGPPEWGPPPNYPRHPLRPGLPPPPPEVAALPVGRNGYPVPWFVAWIGGEPEFRAADPRKLAAAVKYRRCWVCGGPLGAEGVFVVGPMCTVNRVSAEPCSHPACAGYSVRACPFLAKPHMVRRPDADGTMPGVDPGGVMLQHNPGVSALWWTTGAKLFGTPSGPLFDIGQPARVEWYTEGRPATRAEVEAAFAAGLPALEKMAESVEDRLMLAGMVGTARGFWPAAAAPEVTGG